MNNDIINRIELIMSEFGVSTRKEFAENIDVLATNFSQMMQGKRNIGNAIINKIVIRYPRLNKEWLLTGKGSMLREDPNSTMIRGNYNNVGHNNTIGSNNLASEPSVYYAMNQDQIKLMELEIESLKKQLEDKDRIIAAKDQTLKLYEKMLDK